MTPELRKETSELQLHKLGIRINVQLHVTEADEEVRLRSCLAVEQRLLGLWAVSAVVHAESEVEMHAQMRSFLLHQQLQSYLSAEENDFIFSTHITDAMREKFKQRQHALLFLGWCGGLVEKLMLNQPRRAAQQYKDLLAYFSTHFQASQGTLLTNENLKKSLKLRRKSEIMDWSDLLYRLHWAVRHAALTHRPSPGLINADQVREWHQAVNWMCQYDDEDDWDKVSTETA